MGGTPSTVTGRARQDAVGEFGSGSQDEALGEAVRAGPRGGIFTMSIPAGGVDAVDSGPDLAAVGAMSAVADAGHPGAERCRGPGHDDTFVSAIRQVSLTSVNPDSWGIGTQAAHCVLRRIEDLDGLWRSICCRRGW